MEVKTWGDMPEFGFESKAAVDLMLAHDMADFERGAKVAGFRGYFLKGAYYGHSSDSCRISSRTRISSR